MLNARTQEGKDWLKRDSHDALKNGIAWSEWSIFGGGSHNTDGFQIKEAAGSWDGGVEPEIMFLAAQDCTRYLESSFTVHTRPYFAS